MARPRGGGLGLPPTDSLSHRPLPYSGGHEASPPIPYIHTPLHCCSMLCAVACHASMLCACVCAMARHVMCMVACRGAPCNVHVCVPWCAMLVHVCMLLCAMLCACLCAVARHVSACVHECVCLRACWHCCALGHHLLQPNIATWRPLSL